jgi:radical SAM protein (TIGR01212 family)
LQNQFNAIGAYLKNEFGCKVIKLSIDGNFTCPNRDGTLSSGGCIFCSAEGSGEFASNIPDQIELLSNKWPNSKYLAYFQNHTNTYAPVSELREKFYAALDYPGVVGIAIATRPDCLSDDVLELLNEINKITYLWVELGLQTIHEDTAILINRCYPLATFDEATDNLAKLNIKTVVHLILGLPGEGKEAMLESVRYVCNKNIFGIKLHMFNLVKGSTMENLYPDYVPFQTMDDYIKLAAEAIRLIPPHITIHRITGDVPRKILISPSWSYEKLKILNGINKELSTI